MKDLVNALLRIQKTIQNASKDSKNPHFKSTYASLESVLDAIREPAIENGVLFIQTSGKDAEGHFLETRLIHNTGQEIVSKLYLLIDKLNMQGLGSAITYARRYSLTSIFGIGQEDDDGNQASHAPAPSHKKFDNSSKPASVNIKARPDVRALIEPEDDVVYPKQTNAPLLSKEPVKKPFPPLDKISFGPYKGMTVQDAFNKDEEGLFGFVQYVKVKARLEKKILQGVVKEFVDKSELLLGHVPDEDAPPDDSFNTGDFNSFPEGPLK